MSDSGDKPLNQQCVREILSTQMKPGEWYEVKDLIGIIKIAHPQFHQGDITPNPSEPNRPKWHRHVTNSVRMSPGRNDYKSDNTWTELRTLNLEGANRYSIAPRDPIEEKLVKERGEPYSTSGFIYAIINPAWEQWIKIGKTIDLEARLAAYQMYSPLKNYTILASTRTSERHIEENLAHKRAGSIVDSKTSGEWFKISTFDAKDVIAEVSA